MSDPMTPMQVAVRLRSVASTIRGASVDAMAGSWADELEALADELLQDGDTLDAVEGGAVDGEEGTRGGPSSPSLP